MDEEDREGADYQEGYEYIVKVARAALAAKEGGVNESNGKS